MSAALEPRKYADGKAWGVHATMPDGRAGFIPANTDGRKLAQVAWLKVAAALYPDGVPESIPALREATREINEEYRCLTSHALRREGDPLAASVPDKTATSGGWCHACTRAFPSGQEVGA